MLNTYINFNWYFSKCISITFNPVQLKCNPVVIFLNPGLVLINPANSINSDDYSSVIIN